MESMVNGGNKMDFGVVFLFLGGGFLQFLCWWNATRGMINKTSINHRLSTKHYVAPSRCIKKLFRIGKQKIPKYLYYMCYMTIVYFILGPIELALFYAVGDNGILAGHMLLIHYCVVFINAVLFLIISTMYKRK